MIIKTVASTKAINAFISHFLNIKFIEARKVKKVMKKKRFFYFVSFSSFRNFLSFVPD